MWSTNTMKTLFAALVLLLTGANAQAESGFVKLPAGHALYVDYQAARPGKPTLVLVNGLVYSLDRWNKLAAPFAQAGYGILRYNFRGQAATLRQELKTGTPEFYSSGISREDFALELSELMAALKLPKATIVGLSYGAGIAAEFGERFPQKVDRLVFLAPLVVPLDKYDANGAWIHSNLDVLKFYWGPLWGPYVYDYYYNMIFRSYLKSRLVPERIPSDMADIPEDYKEAIFHQVRAMRDFDLRTYEFSKLNGRVHLMLASEEETPALRDQFLAWKNFGPAQGSLVYLSPSTHAIPDAEGALAAEFIAKMIAGDPAFTKGRAYYAPVRGGLRAIVPHTPAQLEERAMGERRD